jgi:ElaB/YqjD/DUF883 family membrane-anchored ribosome-binding protein
MTIDEENRNPERAPQSEALAAAVKRAEAAIERVKELASGADFDRLRADLDQLRSRLGEAAATLYREGRDRLASNEDLARAGEEATSAIRRNPLAAVGIAFVAGLLLALLFRG